MRPLRLAIHGFTTFRERQEVNFEPLELFAITGPTGAGKTSILEAMVFALYGEVPRLGGAHGTSDIVSLGATTAQVDFEFSIAGKGRYRVARRVSRRANVAQTVTFELRDGDTWIPVSERGVRDCNEKLQELIGLNFDGFTRAVVLPQGEFHQFLKGKPDKRRKVLIDLLGVSYFKRMAAIAGTRQRTLSAAVERTDKLLAEQYADATGTHLSEWREAANAAEEHKNTLSVAMATAETQAAIAAAAMQRAAALAARKSTVVALLNELNAKTADLGSLEDGYATAVNELSAETQELASVRGTARSAEDDLRALEAEIGTVMELAAAASASKTLVETADPLQAATTAHGEAVTELERLSDALQGVTTGEVVVEEQLADATRSVEAAASHAASLTQAREAITRQRQTAVSLAQTLAGWETLIADYEARLPQHRQAVEHQRITLDGATAQFDERRRANAAAELAAHLHSGDACPVCGVTLVDAPAVPSEDAAAVERARAEEQSARTELANHERALTQTETQLAQATSSRDDIQRQLSDALAGHPDLTAFADAVERATTDAEAATAQSNVAEEERDSLTVALKAATSEVTSARLAVTTAKGQVDTCQTRIDAIDERRSEASAVLIARFGDTIPDHAATIIAEQQANLRGAATAVETARAAVEKHTTRYETARTRAETSATALRDVDDAITRAHAQAEAAIATTAVAPAQLDLGLPRNRAEARHDSIAALNAWGTSAQSTLTAAQAKTTAEGDQASARLIALAQSHTNETPGDAKHASELLKEADQSAVREAAVAHAAVEECERRIAERETIEAEAATDREQIALLTALAGDLREDRFGEYIVQETIGLLSARASEELLRISGGHYSLTARGDDFYVIDHHNADEQRSVRTLSGGETFLASLALALALSRHIGELASEGLGAKLESVFIDEGFGTLDPATLEDVMDALERLRADNLVVGVISHVPELAQRIQSGLVVGQVDGRSRILPSDEE